MYHHVVWYTDSEVLEETGVFLFTVKGNKIGRRNFLRNACIHALDDTASQTRSP